MRDSNCMIPMQNSRCLNPILSDGSDVIESMTQISGSNWENCIAVVFVSWYVFVYTRRPEYLFDKYKVAEHSLTISA